MNPPRLSPALLLLAAATSAWTGCQRSDATARAHAVAVVPVQTAVAEQKDVPRVIEAVGAVQALRTVSVKSQVDGVIAQIHFHEGDEVKAGDLLISLDRRPFENALRIARADLENARAQAAQADADVERYRRLDQQDAISKEQFAQLQTKSTAARAVMQAKEAAVSNAELQLSYTEIKAPISGRTGQLLLHEGALVKANDVNQSIVALNQLAPIAAAFSVPESTLTAIRAAAASGSAAVTVIDRNNGVSRSDGRLTFIDNSVDATTGTIVLKAEFANEDHALWPGQFVQAQLAVGVDHNVVVVPSSAVQVGQNTTHIYVVKPDHTVELRAVRVARAAGESTVLTDGVRAGETVVTDGQLRLVPGVKVESKSLGDTAGSATAPASP
jgi:multidrug efflux system membrane fusion protein